MEDIKIIVEGKVASVVGTPSIVCGNSDYTLSFAFDDKWSNEQNKVARFSFNKNGLKSFIDVPIHNDTCKVPVLLGIGLVRVGVYAGELKTTTGAKIRCTKSILCDDADEMVEPFENLYEELNKKIEEIKNNTGGGSGVDLDILTEVDPEEEHTNEQLYGAKALDDMLLTFEETIQYIDEGKQDTLISGKNIKTINGESLLGSGNIPISGSSGGSTNNKVFERIATVIVVPDEDGNLPTKISITADDDGNPFELTDIYCEVLMGLTDGTVGRFYIQADKLSLIGNAPLNFTNTALRKWFFRYDSFGEGNGGLVSAPNGSISAGINFPSANFNTLFGQPVPVGTTLNIKSLNFVGQVGDTKTFMEGTTITLWGVRK